MGVASYITPAEVRTRLRSGEIDGLAALLNLENGGDPEGDPRLEAAISDASGLMAPFLLERYPDPWEQTPAVLTMIAFRIVRHLLARDEQAAVDFGAGGTGRVAADYKEAMDMLRDIASGKMRLSAPDVDLREQEFPMQAAEPSSGDSSRDAFRSALGSF